MGGRRGCGARFRLAGRAHALRGRRPHARCQPPRSPRDESESYPPRKKARLTQDHGPQEKDQDADGDEGERAAREKLRCAIEILAALGIHKCDQGENEPEAITDQRQDDSRSRRPTSRGARKRTDDQSEPKEEKRREPKFAQVMHARVL